MKVQDALFLTTIDSDGVSEGDSDGVSSRDVLSPHSLTPSLTIHRVELQSLTSGAVSGIVSERHCRRVVCVSGAVFAVVVDLRPESPSFREWDGEWMAADDTHSLTLVVPPRCGLALYSPHSHTHSHTHGSTVLIHHCGPLPPPPTASLTHSTTSLVGVLWSDPTINISWPFTHSLTHSHPHSPPLTPIISKQHATLPLLHTITHSLTLPPYSCDVLLYGSKGYLGSNLLTTLLNQGVHVCCSTTRLEDLPALLHDSTTYRPRRVMNCAGVTGTPNIMWCETHRPETARSNLTGVMNLLDVYTPLDIHVTTIGTGYTESDPPSYHGNVYTRLRVAQESIVEEVFPDKCLTLRVQYPLSSDMHRGCCLTKLLNYSKIFGSPTSMTVVDDLFPYINTLSLTRVTGPLNFTNPGRLDNVTLLTMYKDMVDSSVTFEEGSEEETVKYLSIPRPFSLLDTTRLVQLCPGVKSVEKAVHDLLVKVASERVKE